MNAKQAFKMTIQQIVDFATSTAVTAEDLQILSAEVERRIRKRQISGKAISRKYFNALTMVKGNMQ
jgi:4-alpha-glucanotransferase